MAQKVLIVEETPIILTLLTYLLQQNGYDVQGASDPREGLKMAKVMSFDLIFYDIKIPGGDSIKLIPLLKGEERLKNIPIIVLSGASLETLRIDKELVEAYLTKPVQPGILMQKVKSILPSSHTSPIEVDKSKFDDFEKRAEKRKSSDVKVVEGFPVEATSVDSLKGGMTVGDEVFDNNHVSIIMAGTSLTDKLIDKLKSLEIKEIYIRN